MRRIALIATIVGASLWAVSIGVGQFPYPPNDAPQYVAPVPGIAPARSENMLPLVAQPRAIACPAPMACAPVAPGETMTVKVYSVPDLVATVHAAPAVPSPFAANQELAQLMQQVQLASAQAASPSGPSDEVTTKLERLKKALRVAAPRRSWEDDGGNGVIEAYPDALCLIVRQSASAHEAIADLLSQLRATQDVQIELAVEMMTFDGVADEQAAEAMRLLNKDLSPEELAQFRTCGAQTATSSIVRMANGRSASAGHAMLPLQFTAVASADRSMVEVRTDFTVPMDSEAPLTQSQSRSVTVGKTFACLIGTEDFVVLLITPSVVDRSHAPAK